MTRPDHPDPTSLPATGPEGAGTLEAGCRGRAFPERGAGWGEQAGVGEAAAALLSASEETDRWTDRQQELGFRSHYTWTLASPPSQLAV